VSEISPGVHDAFEAEIGRLIAQDEHWMMQRLDAPDGLIMDGGPSVIADTRYTRVLRKMAEAFIAELEKDADE
jgi:hypothetical protein